MKEAMISFPILLRLDAIAVSDVSNDRGALRSPAKLNTTGRLMHEKLSSFSPPKWHVSSFQNSLQL